MGSGYALTKMEKIRFWGQLSPSKRSKTRLEEQQRDLHVGLDKLRDTVTQVEELRKSLAIKRTQLEAKNAEANEKLKQMVSDQQEAEQKIAASIEIQAALVEQDKQESIFLLGVDLLVGGADGVVELELLERDAVH